MIDSISRVDAVQGKWIKRKNNNYNSHRLTCPICKRTFIMPKAWGVWKGCPSCWIKLNPPKGGDTE